MQKSYFCLPMKIKMNWDGVGIATSLLCAIHCAVLPMIISAIPLMGIDLVHNEFFEWIMILAAIIIGYYSLIHGYSRHHRSHTPIIIFSVGAVFLVFKQFLPEHSIVFLTIAVSLIVSAHLINYRLCRVRKCNSEHHKHWSFFLIIFYKIFYAQNSPCLVSLRRNHL